MTVGSAMGGSSINNVLVTHNILQCERRGDAVRRVVGGVNGSVDGRVDGRSDGRVDELVIVVNDIDKWFGHDGDQC